jgi:MFS-type transporter involved in bile tolerance (Atg22 family)
MTDWPRRYRDGSWFPYLKGLIVFLLITAVGAFLGIAYAGLVDRRFGPKDWRRWTALMPFWVLAVGVALTLHAVNMRGLAPQAIQAFAMGSLVEALIDSLRALRRRRVDASTRHDESVAPLR